jgi:hypothetical protein
MKLVLFVIALGSACLGVLAVVFRRELRPHVEAFGEWRRRRRQARAARAGTPAPAAIPDAPAKMKPAKAKKPPDPKRTNGMVAGVSCANQDGTDRQTIIRKNCRKGTALTLVREPDNPRDRNAVAIYVGRSLIGYVSSEDAPRVAKCLDEGWSSVASVARIYGGTKDKPNLGVNFLIVQTPA